MKTMRNISLILLTVCLSCSQQNDNDVTKGILGELLKNTHTNTDWFVPLNNAVANLTSEQANWKDSLQNHSICELVSHNTFWNERILLAFQGKKLQDFNNVNEQTFTRYCFDDWEKTVHRSDSIQSAWEEALKHSSKDHVEKWASEIANMSAHIAYHTGQIVYIRKLNGWWKSEQ